MLHVLPDGFVKIRHYGLLAPANAKTRLELARQLLLPRDTVLPAALVIVLFTALALAGLAGPRPIDWRQRLKLLAGIDLSLCPRCGVGTMLQCPLPVPWDTS